MSIFLFLEPKIFISLLYYKILIKRNLEVFLYIVRCEIYLFISVVALD
jgi:hypothetical protein